MPHEPRAQAPVQPSTVLSRGSDIWGNDISSEQRQGNATADWIVNKDGGKRFQRRVMDRHISWGALK